MTDVTNGDGLNWLKTNYLRRWLLAESWSEQAWPRVGPGTVETDIEAATEADAIVV